MPLKRLQYSQWMRMNQCKMPRSVVLLTGNQDAQQLEPFFLLDGGLYLMHMYFILCFFMSDL